MNNTYYKIFFTGNLNDAEEMVIANIEGTSQFNREYLGQSFTKPLAIEMMKTFGQTLVGTFELTVVEEMRIRLLGDECKMSSREETVGVYDMEGKEIRSIVFTGKQFVLETGLMQPGIYFLQITDDKLKTAKGMIIVQ